MKRERVAKAYLVALWLVCVYRAATQSIVHDEALTYQLYLKGPFAQVFHVFSANHHFLNTLFMYGCASVFGVSELSLRLPALAGAALYFAAVYRVSRRAFGNGRIFLLAVALLTLHPFILDFMVAARGYGMALGLWLWSFSMLLPCLEEPDTWTPRRIVEAALALALSVVANLVFVVPAFVLAAISVWFLRKPRVVVIYFLAPIVAVAALFLLVSPLHTASSDNFYTGASSIAASLRSLARVTVAHSRAWRDSHFTGWARDALAFLLAPSILLTGLVVRCRVLARVCSAIATGSALLLWILHHAFHVLYPEDRTGIYFLPLLLLILLSLAHGPSPKPCARVAHSIAMALLVLFLIQWNVRKFFIWEYDADTREIGERIAARVLDKPPNSVRIGNSWGLEPALNFYRERNHWTWMEPPTRAPLVPGLDYYTIIAIDRAEIEKLKLWPLFEGTASGTVLAVPSRNEKDPGF